MTSTLNERRAELGLPPISGARQRAYSDAAFFRGVAPYWHDDGREEHTPMWDTREKPSTEFFQVVLRITDNLSGPMKKAMAAIDAIVVSKSPVPAPKPRCYYCNILQVPERTSCAQCGGEY